MPVGPSKRSRYSPPMRSQVGEDSSSFSIGNSQDGEYESTADGLDAGFESGLVSACARPERTLMPRKTANSIDLCVLIKIAPLMLIDFSVCASQSEAVFGTPQLQGMHPGCRTSEELKSFKIRFL